MCTEVKRVMRMGRALDPQQQRLDCVGLACVCRNAEDKIGKLLLRVCGQKGVTCAQRLLVVFRSAAPET